MSSPMLRLTILFICLQCLLPSTVAQESTCPSIEGIVPRSSARSWCYREAWKIPMQANWGIHL
jgi:hypothetical protein